MEDFTESFQKENERVEKLPRSANTEFSEAVNKLREEKSKLWTTDQALTELRRVNPGLAARYDAEHGLVFRSTFSQ